MKTLYILLCLALISLQTQAQPTVNICVENTGSELEVKIQPNGFFADFMSNVQLTLVSDDPSVTYGLPAGNPLYTTLAKAGATTAFGGKAYQKFAGFGTASLSALGSSWSAGEIITLFTIVPSNLSASYSIGADSWTIDNNGVYYVELNAFDKTGASSTCSSFVLPIEGLQFEAQANENHTVQLRWQTQTELHTDYFAIEKRVDDKTFAEIATVKAAGNSLQPLTYQYLDKSPMGLKNDYRLRTVDLDGVYQYSEVRTVSWQAISSIGSLFPNPCREETHLSLFLDKSSLIHSQLFNGLGQLVWDDKQERQAGSQLLTISTQNLAEGIYQLRVSRNGQSLTSRVLEVLR